MKEFLRISSTLQDRTFFQNLEICVVRLLLLIIIHHSSLLKLVCTVFGNSMVGLY